MKICHDGAARKWGHSRLCLCGCGFGCPKVLSLPHQSLILHWSHYDCFGDAGISNVADFVVEWAVLQNDHSCNCLLFHGVHFLVLCVTFAAALKVHSSSVEIRPGLSFVWLIKTHPLRSPLKVTADGCKASTVLAPKPCQENTGKS